MDNTVNMTIRIDKKLKKETDSLFKNLGLNTTSAITIFLKQCTRNQGLPFTPTMLAQEPSRELLNALKEAEQIRKNPDIKGYNTVNDLMKALND